MTLKTTLSTATYKQFADTDPKEIEQDKLEILDALLTAKGYENRRSAKELAERTTIAPSTVRDAIIELREQYSVPVANRGTGYFLITDENELQSILDYYQKEIETKQQRKRAITQAYNTTQL